MSEKIHAFLHPGLVYPSRKEALKNTAIVIASMAVIALFIFAVDSAIIAALSAL